VLPIDRPDVAATNRRGFRFDQDLAMARFGNGKVSQFYRTVSREHRSSHSLIHINVFRFRSAISLSRPRELAPDEEAKRPRFAQLWPGNSSNIKSRPAYEMCDR
jgi:hypothetical protein